MTAKRQITLKIPTWVKTIQRFLSDAHSEYYMFQKRAGFPVLFMLIKFLVLYPLCHSPANPGKMSAPSKITAPTAD